MTDADTVSLAQNPRLLVVVRIERALLVLRYLTFAALLGFYLADRAAMAGNDFALLTTLLLLRSTFVYWVLQGSRTRLLQSSVNFVSYLFEASLLVELSGAHQSSLANLYILVVIGYAIYSPLFTRAIRVSLVCGAAYVLMVLIHVWRHEAPLPISALLTQCATIVVGGWLMSLLGGLLPESELTAQEHAQALASSEATLRTILNSAGSPICVYGDNELITEANEPACAFFGLPRSELTGRRFRSLLFDDGTLPSKMANLRTRGELHGEHIALTENGDERDVELHVRSFIFDARRYFVAMMHDITEQKEFQEATRLGTLRLEQANQELKELGAMRTAFLATVSQRLRSPLCAILGFVDMLLSEEMGEVSSEQRQALQGCRRSVMRVFTMVDDAFEGSTTSDAGQS